jgi:hypothetical protein
VVTELVEVSKYFIHISKSLYNYLKSQVKRI